jgi:GT2 family glycosyltransferase
MNNTANPLDRRFLVVVRASDASLHPHWLATAAERNWDLVVNYGGEDPRRFALEGDGVIRIDSRGARWPALAQLLGDTRQGWCHYDYIWLPADDIDISGDDINRLFDIAVGLELQLAQPSFSDDSSASSPLARNNRAFRLRFANFVDPAAALFSRRLLEQALPGLAQTTDGAAWQRLLANPARECAVLDCIQVRRQGAAGAHPPGALCYGGFDASGRLHSLFDPADDGFVRRLREGFAGAAAMHGVFAEHAAARRDVLGTATPPAAGSTDFALTVATSIAPRGEVKQQRAVASWRALGFDVVSFNNSAEIEALQGLYPDVRFVEVQRDGRERTGKPLVRVDDVFAWFRASGLPRGGFINSDIVLQPADAAGFLAELRTDIQGAMVFSRRIEVQSLERLDGEPYPPGFDVWFWDSCVLGAFDQPTDYYVGFPHWDYYAVLMPLLHGFPIRQFAYPIAFHETHPMYYDVVRDGIPYGLKTFKLVAPLMDRIPQKNDQLTPVLQYFLQHQPGAMQRPEDVNYYFVFLHALDAWFVDIIDRNSEKLLQPRQRAALRQAATAIAAAPAPVAQPAPRRLQAVASVHQPQPASAPAPELSVIIPTFNRAPILARCLQHLAAQTLAGERFEIIVVDDGSADTTAQVLADAQTGCTLIHERQANLGPAAARNRGLRRARGQWVLFLNDDALLDPQALAIHLAEHARRGPRAAVLGAFPMHPDYARLDAPVGHCLNHSDLVFDYWRMVPDHAYDHHHFYTCNLSIAREFVLRHAGFDEGFVRMGAEDIELGLRLQQDGCEVFYRPDCIARHAHRLDVQGLARMYQFRGRGGVHLFVREPRKLPHYADMPVSRIDEFLAIDSRLQPLLPALEAAIAGFDQQRFTATGAQGVPLDERSSGIDLRMLWMWPEAEIRRLVETLTSNLLRHTERAAAGGAGLEEAAGRIYPALQFVKWYHDTLGMMSSAEIRPYLAARQAAARKAA